MIKSILDKFKKPIKKSQIKYLIWDFDGTLYQDPNIGKVIKSKYLEHLKKNKIFLAEEIFDELSRNIGSWGKTSSILLEKPEIEILDEIEKLFNIEEHLKPNRKIVDLLEGLTNYKHAILSNSSEEYVKKGLNKIGFNKKNGNYHHPFEKFFCRNNSKRLKPDPVIFQEVVSYTKLHPINHLVIGDSYVHDIEPALNMGMQAVLIDDLEKYLS